MATVRNNSITQAFSGMLGDQIVFRQLRGKTIVAKRPKPARRQSKLQKENRMRFKDAARFAKTAMYNPQKKIYYWEKARELGLPNAYTAAITEYMRRTTVKSSDHCPARMPVRSGLTTIISVQNQQTETSTTHLWTVNCLPAEAFLDSPKLQSYVVAKVGGPWTINFS